VNTTKPLKIIFAGTPVFAAVALEALLSTSHTIKAVYTQPDRPAGRGQKYLFSPVKQLAVQHQLPIYQPTTLRDEQTQKQLADLQADIMIVAAYGLILPNAILQTPPLGCINIHASLLPRWRGAAPIQRAILAGDTKTGIAIMQMAEGLDTGPVLFQQECVIGPTDTSVSLHDRLATLGADALLTTLNQLTELIAKPQDDTQATYAHKITKEEAKIDWSLPAIMLDRQVRAFNPWPVAFTSIKDQTVRIWNAKIMNETPQTQPPGTILHVDASGIDVATGEGTLRLLEIQFSGGKRLSIADVLNAKRDLFAAGVFV
jgi:methionyl-tRNA formyltransferase